MTGMRIIKTVPRCDALARRHLQFTEWVSFSRGPGRKRWTREKGDFACKRRHQIRRIEDAEYEDVDCIYCLKRIRELSIDMEPLKPDLKYWESPWYLASMRSLEKGQVCRAKWCRSAAMKFIGRDEFYCDGHFYTQLRERLKNGQQ